MSAAATPRHEYGPESVAFERWRKLASLWTVGLLIAFGFAMVGCAQIALGFFAAAVAWWAIASERAQHWYRRWQDSVQP